MLSYRQVQAIQPKVEISTKLRLNTGVRGKLADITRRVGQIQEIKQYSETQLIIFNFFTVIIKEKSRQIMLWVVSKSEAVFVALN